MVAKKVAKKLFHICRFVKSHSVIGASNEYEILDLGQLLTMSVEHYIAYNALALFFIGYSRYFFLKIRQSAPFRIIQNMS